MWPLKASILSYQVERGRRNALKIAAAILVIIFSTTQVTWGQEYLTITPQGQQAVKSVQEEPPAIEVPPPVAPVQEPSQQFLENTLTLTPSTPEKKDEEKPLFDNTEQKADLKKEVSEFQQQSQGYDYERYDFQDAKDLLRSEYATAVVLKDLKADDLKELVNLGFETGIFVLHGEIVLFTSGSEDEVGVMPAVQALTKKASLISHTHPSIYSEEGPSGQDINEAVEAPGQEYVITHKGVYAYNNQGILNDGNPYTYDWYLEQLNQALETSKADKDQVAARQDLNQFIAEQDQYNQAPEEERVTLRRGGTLTYTAGLTTANLTTFSGSPRPYLTPGSTAATALSANVSANRFLLGYSVPQAGNASGFVISFDDASTPGVETGDISKKGYLTFGLLGPNPSVRLEIMDVNGVKDTWTLTNIASTVERFWRLPVASISNALNKTRIKQINFIVGQANTTATTRTGTLKIRTLGLNTNPPAPPAVTSVVPEAVNKTSVTISGTKEANASILINGVQAVARDSSTTWSATLNLATEGNNTFNITAKNSIGLVSTARMVTILRDTVVPTGSIDINSSAPYTASQTVTLNLSASDSGSGLDKMSFSDDNINWSTPENYVTTKQYSLPAGDGNKIVYVKFFDKAGNASAVSSKTIGLDTTLPSGSVKINGGASSTDSPNVQLTLTAVDSGSGLDKVRVSADGGQNWDAWEDFAANRALTLSAGTGTREVRYQVRDKAGNIATFAASIELLPPPPEIVFTSAASSAFQDYVLTYRFDSQTYSETWRLAAGDNDLFVRVPVPGKDSLFSRYKVTWNQAQSAIPEIPQAPSLPDNIVSVTTESGQVLKYDQGLLKAVEQPGEYQLFYPETDSGGNLTGGVLVYASGARLLYKNSRPVYEISKTGEKTFYDTDGTVLAYETTDGQRIRFAYRLDGAGKKTGILSLEETATSLYAGQEPVWVNMADGTDIRYENGFLQQYRDASGNRFLYQTTEILSATQVTGYSAQLTGVIPAGQFSIIAYGNLLASLQNYPSIKKTLEEKLSTEIEYDVSKKMKTVTTGKGEILELQKGLPSALTDSGGNKTEINASTDARGALDTIDFSDASLSQSFDGSGDLKTVTLAEGTALEIKSLRVNEILLSEGSVLSQLKWNGSSLTDFTRTKPDGTKEIYQNSRLVRKEETNGNVTTYVFLDGADRPDFLTTSDGRTYHFIEYQNSNGLKDRIAELLKIDLPDGSRVEFENGKPVRFIEKKEIQLDPLVTPVLPNGQSYIPSIVLPNAELRAVTIDQNAAILSGEILLNDGTQYILKDGKILKQVTPDGRMIEIDNTALPPFEKHQGVPPVWYSPEELAYRQQLTESQLNYFVDGVGLDPKTGFPMDNYNAETGAASNYSQATLIGYWAEILAAIARGDYPTSHMTSVQALSRLETLLKNTIDVQDQAGWNGLFSFFTIAQETHLILDATGKPTGQTETVNVYHRAFSDIGIGDNLNLSVSLGSVVGAIGAISDPALSVSRDRILSYIYHILGKQDTGYSAFYDSSSKRFHMALQFSPDGSARFAGSMDRVFNEFLPGLVWLASRNPVYREAVNSLDVAVRPYQTADGTRIENAVPFDGGAFQMFWPLMHVDETKYPEFDVALKNFLYTQSEYVQTHGIPGLLSAGADPGAGYNGKMGLPAAAETDDPLKTSVGSIYGTASAFLLAPHYTLQFLKNIQSAFPGVQSPLGWADSLGFQDVTHTDPVTHQSTTKNEMVISKRYFGVDQAGFLLSLMGTSRSYFQTYLQWNGWNQSFDDIYRSMSFGLTPVAKPNPAVPGLGVTGTPLIGGSGPDGRSAGLVKRPAFVSTLTDTEFGEGKIYDYLDPDGKFHHTEIEFTPADGSQVRTMGLQEYLLLPGRGPIARSLFDGMSFDLLNESVNQGGFYTPGSGYANAALGTDAALGEVRRLHFDFQQVTKPVGIFALYNSRDLSPYDYLSVPVKLGPDTPPGVSLKFEFKGLGEIYVTGPVSQGWQFFQIPVVKPAGLLSEIAVVIQSPDGRPIKGEVDLGPLSAFKVRTSNEINWTTLLGKNDAEIRNLLKAKALERPENGGTVLAEEVLENFTVDHDGKLVNGVLKRADGSIQYFSQGRLNKWVFSNGRTVIFEKGLATFMLDLARGHLEEGHYYYDQTFRGQIKSFVLQDNDSKRIYGSDGKLVTMVEGGRTLNFKDGKMDTIVLPEAVLSQLVFADDQSLLKAHVRMNDGTEFEINQSAAQVIVRPNGVKVFYNGKQIVAVETPQNGRTTFDYTLNAIGQLIGVNTTFTETTTDPVTQLPVMTTRQMSLFDYIARSERSLEKNEILREPPLQLFPISYVGSFSVGWLPSGEITWGVGSYSSQAWYQFRYNSTDGPILGMVVGNYSQPASVGNYDFIQVQLKQDPNMTWSQDVTMKLKTPTRQTLYTFQVDNAPNQYQTFGFPLAGKSGSEGELTFEVAREAAGVGKTGTLYFKDLSYLSVKTLEHPLWESMLTMSASEVQSLKVESRALDFIGAEVASGKPLQYSRLTSLLDMPSWIVYSDQSVSNTGQITDFKRFDGSEVMMNGQNVSKIILPNGTVNEYSASANSATGVIQGPGGDPASKNQTDYHYGALRRVMQADGRQYDFSYQFDDGGAEITAIKDSVTGDERRFKGGKLISSSSTGGLQTRYGYEGGAIKTAEMVYKNKVLESTQYRFTPEETLVTDEEGTTWYYDQNGTLTKHLTAGGLLYRYTDYSLEWDSPVPLSPNDYKSKLIGAAGLRAVYLAGYEAPDGSQLIYDHEKDGVAGELKLASGQHGVNLVFDNNQRMRSGQIQFADGLILEIENYIPVRGRYANGTLFTTRPGPSGGDYEIIQKPDGAFDGFRFKKDGSAAVPAGGKSYVYDASGRMQSVESETGDRDTFTYQQFNGSVSALIQKHRSQLKFNGVPFPKEVIGTGSTDSQKIVESGNEVASHDGAGFTVAVFKDSLNQWDTFSGTFASAGDRFSLEKFLQEIKPGQSVAAVISDAALSQAGESLLKLFEGLGAGQIRQAATQGGNWSFFGQQGLKPGEAKENLGTGFVSTVTETTTTTPIYSEIGQLVFDGLNMDLKIPPVAVQAYSGMLQGYEKMKQVDDQQLVTVYDSKGNVAFTRRLDGVYSYYETGKIRETFDSNGELLYTHEYVCPPAGCQSGDDMKLEKITLAKTRRDFEKQSAQMEEQIEQAKFDALYRLAWQDEAARVRVKEEVDNGLAAINSQISSLQSQRFQDVKQCHRGFLGIGKSCQHFTVEVPGVQDAINQLSSQRSELLAAQEQELAKIPGEVAVKKQEIEDAAASQLVEFHKKQDEFLLDILHQEMRPVLMDIYRRIYGRDPSTQEVDAWVGRFKTTQRIKAAEVETELSSAPEMASRQNQKASIIAGVRSFLTNYLAASDSSKASLLAGLQLNASETVSLDSSDTGAILTWLEGQDLHFGESAFRTLQETLASRGRNVDVQTIGGEALLIDILTGTINRFTEGELVISVFALTRTAKIHGEDLTGVKYSFQDLLDLYRGACPDPAAPCSLRIIARIGGDHFVVVTQVTAAGTVRYREVSKGVEGEEITVASDQFLKVWETAAGAGGYLVMGRDRAIAAKQLTDAQAQKIRGAFFVIDDLIFWSFVASVVLSVASYAVSFFSPTLGRILGIAAMVAGIVSIVANVGNLVVQGVKMIYSQIAAQGLFTTLKQGALAIGRAVFDAVKFAGNFIKSGFTFVKDVLTSGLSKLGQGIMDLGKFLLKPQGIIYDASHNEIGRVFLNAQASARNLVAVGLNYGVSKGLEGLGLNPVLANLGTAFISSGLLGAGSGLSGFLKSGVQALLIQGVSEMGLKLNLPPPITSALSLVTKSSLNAFFDPTLTLKQALTNIAPQVAQKLVLGGMDLIGRSLGFNASIARLVGLPLSATVGGIVWNLINPGSLSSPGSIFNTIKNSLFSSQTVGGIVSVGASFGLDAIGAPPFISNFLPNLFGSLISSGLGSGGSGGGGPGIIGQGGNILKRLVDNVLKFGKGIVSIGQQVISFGSKVIEGVGSVTKAGFAKAVDFFSGFFDRKTEETLFNAGNGNIQNAILNSNFLDMGNGLYKTTVNFGGETIAIDWNKGADQFTYSSGNVIAKAAGFGMSGDRFLGNIAIAEDLGDGIKLDSHFVAGDVVDIEGVDPNALKFRIIRVNPGEDVLPISITNEGMFYNIPIRGTGLVFSSTGNGFWNDPASQKTGIADLSKRFIGDVTQDRLAAGEVPLPLIDPLTGDPAKDREGRYLTANSLPLTLYESTNFGIVENFVIWAPEFIGFSPLSGSLEKELRSYFDLIEYNKQYYGLQDDQFSYVHFAHSGNFMPMLKALDHNPDIPIKTIISYEGPDFMTRTIHNPNLDRIIQVRGTQGLLGYEFGGFPISGVNGAEVKVVDLGPPAGLEFRDYKGVDAAGNERTIENIHIEILNARHNDFDYHPDDPDPVFREISRKTNLFMRDMQEIADNSERLDIFLSTHDGISYDKTRKVYVVDPTKYKSAKDITQ